MKKHRGLLFLLFTLILVASLAVFGCAAPSPTPTTAPTATPTAPAAPVELSIAQWSPPIHHSNTHVWTPWAEALGKATNGRVTATVFSGGALGKPTEHYDLASTGSADIAQFNPGFTPGRFPLSAVIELPFLAPSVEVSSGTIWELYTKYPQFQAEYDPVKLLAIWTTDPLQLHTVNKPVRTMEDMKGLQLRVSSESVGKMVAALGATPVFMPMTDLYIALDRGTIDGALYTIEAVQSFRLAEVTKYTTIIGLSTVESAAGININTWNKLPKDVQGLITTGDLGIKWLMKGHNDGQNLGMSEGNALLKQHGVEIITLAPAEMQRWENALLPLREEWVKAMEAKGLPGRAILDDAVAIEKRMLGK